jgi:hypothetical protein
MKLHFGVKTLQNAKICNTGAKHLTRLKRSNNS